MQHLLFDYLDKYIRLSEEEKQALIDLDIFKPFKKGTVLLKEGETAKEGYFVIKGCLRVHYMIEGEEKTTAFYTESQGFTSASLTNQEPSEYFISCVEDCTLLVANPDMEEMIFEKFPKFETLCRVMSEEIMLKQQTDFDIFRISSPEQRYLTLLEHRPDLIQRVPQYQLASYLGMKPQSLSRIRSRLASKSK